MFSLESKRLLLELENPSRNIFCKVSIGSYTEVDKYVNFVNHGILFALKFFNCWVIRSIGSGRINTPVSGFNEYGSESLGFVCSMVCINLR
jgi:hypothetical protein